MSVVWIVDIDYTIADSSQREGYLRTQCLSCGTIQNFHNTECYMCTSGSLCIPAPCWDQFNDPKLVIKDIPNKKAQKVLTKAGQHGIDIHFITGRKENVRKATIEWLTEHFAFSPNKNALYMRAVDDLSQPSAYKKEAFQAFRSKYSYGPDTLFMFFDDEAHVLAMYKSFGLVMKAPDCWDVLYPSLPFYQENSCFFPESK